MTTYNTGNPIGSTDPRDLYDNAENFDKAVNDRTAATWTDRLGVARKTVFGAFQDITYKTPEAYAVGLSFLTTDANKTVEESGVVYAPLNSALPFTTSGTFVGGDDAKFYPVQDKNNVIRVTSVASMAAYAAPVGYVFSLNAGGRSGDFDVVAGDFSTELAADTLNGVYVGLSDNPLATTKVAKRRGAGQLVTPEFYGADPTGTDDSADAIEAAIESGYIVDWGYGTFLVSRELGAGTVITHAIRWRSNGATVTLNSAAEVAALLNYTIKPLDHSIDGQINFDANNLATIGFGLRNKEVISFPSSFATLYANGLGAKNARKNSAFRGGDGIRIEGSFKWVVLDNPTVRSVVMPAGQGTPGVSGVSGLTITRDSDSGGYSLYTEINNPDITDVESLDLNYNDDQDGIQIFGAYLVGQLFNSFLVSGGKVENAFGRSIKSQSSTGRVTGTKLIKNRGLTTPFTGPDIDFQQGEGIVDVLIDYDGYVPGSVVSQRIGETNKTSGRVDGVRGTVTGGVVLDSVVTTFSKPNLPITYIDNINIQGSINKFVQWLVPNDSCVLYGENWYASEVLEAAVEIKTGGVLTTSTDKAFVNLLSVSQDGAAVQLLRQRVVGNQVEGVLSASKVIGFTSKATTTGLASSSESPANVNKLGGPLFPGINRRDTFAIEGFSESLVNNEAFTLTLSANGIYQIWFDFNQTSFAIISASSSSGGRIAEISVGTAVAVDQLAEPTTGSFRVWCDNTGLLKIRNVSGSTRQMHIKRDAAIVGK